MSVLDNPASDGGNIIIHGETFTLGNYSGNIRLTTSAGVIRLTPYNLTVVPNIHNLTASIDEGSSVAAGSTYTLRVLYTGVGLSTPEVVDVNINSVVSRLSGFVQNSGDQLTLIQTATAPGVVNIKATITSPINGSYASPIVTLNVF